MLWTLGMSFAVFLVIDGKGRIEHADVHAVIGAMIGFVIGWLFAHRQRKPAH